MGLLSWSWELDCKVMTSRHVPLDRRIFDFRFLISDFWFLISDLNFPFSDFWFLISDFRFPISDLGFGISYFWLPFSVFRFRISDFGLRIRISDFGFLISDFLFPKSRFLISVFDNQKIPAINFWVMIYEIQKTDWPQSFLIVSSPDFSWGRRNVCTQAIETLYKKIKYWCLRKLNIILFILFSIK